MSALRQSLVQFYPSLGLLARFPPEVIDTIFKLAWPKPSDARRVGCLVNKSVRSFVTDFGFSTITCGQPTAMRRSIAVWIPRLLAVPSIAEAIQCLRIHGPIAEVPGRLARLVDICTQGAPLRALRLTSVPMTPLLCAPHDSVIFGSFPAIELEDVALDGESLLHLLQASTVLRFLSIGSACRFNGGFPTDFLSGRTLVHLAASVSSEFHALNVDLSSHRSCTGLFNIFHALFLVMHWTITSLHFHGDVVCAGGLSELLNAAQENINDLQLVFTNPSKLMWSLPSLRAFASLKVLTLSVPDFNLSTIAKSLWELADHTCCALHITIFMTTFVLQFDWAHLAQVLCAGHWPKRSVLVSILTDDRKLAVYCLVRRLWWEDTLNKHHLPGNRYISIHVITPPSHISFPPSLPPVTWVEFGDRVVNLLSIFTNAYKSKKIIGLAYGNAASEPKLVSVPIKVGAQTPETLLDADTQFYLQDAYWTRSNDDASAAVNLVLDAGETKYYMMSCAGQSVLTPDQSLNAKNDILSSYIHQSGTERRPSCRMWFGNALVLKTKSGILFDMEAAEMEVVDGAISTFVNSARRHRNA